MYMEVTARNVCFMYDAKMMMMQNQLSSGLNKLTLCPRFPLVPGPPLEPGSPAAPWNDKSENQRKWVTQEVGPLCLIVQCSMLFSLFHYLKSWESWETFITLLEQRHAYLKYCLSNLSLQTYDTSQTTHLPSFRTWSAKSISSIFTLWNHKTVSVKGKRYK